MGLSCQGLNSCAPPFMVVCAQTIKQVDIPLMRLKLPLSDVHSNNSQSQLGLQSYCHLLNILYNTRIPWKTQFREVDETGVDEKGVDGTSSIDKTGINH